MLSPVVKDCTADTKHSHNRIGVSMVVAANLHFRTDLS